MKVRYTGTSDRRIISSADIERSFGIEDAPEIDVTKTSPTFDVSAQLAAKLFESMPTEFAPQATRAVPPDADCQPKDQRGKALKIDDDDEIIEDPDSDDGDVVESAQTKAESATSRPKSRAPKSKR